ncbi:pentatricopeptide repeat-containing protein At2g30780-like [Camellia sinensis]|uniref:pentatricopeptide repeat-containing protein At2g30780-like n=1 Tax=Camellia sinensis TaxID=4442 RepID=UPI001036D7C9|nr:pentatricopeptide repeat-containing protein At2g30780-like [Camellia sinensis]
MALVCRTRVFVSVVARKGLWLSRRPQSFLPIPWKNCCGLIRFHSNSSSSSLVTRLIEAPNSRIKATLDAEEDNDLTLKSFDFSWDALLDSLFSSSPHKARLVLEWRLEKILKDKERNPGCYSELISMCGKIKNVPLAMQVFTSMEANGIEPTSGIFNALILTCLSSANVITALSLYEVMENSDGYKPNSETYNAFISAFANLGNDKAMQAWYSARNTAGFSADLQTYKSLISGFAKLKKYDAVESFYEEMVLSGITPNVPILEMVLGGICEQRNLIKIKDFLKFILDGGWKINGIMAEKLVGLYYDLGKVEEMEEMLTTLMKSSQGLKTLSPVHLGIIRMYAMLDRLDDVEYSVGRMLRQGISFKCPEDVDKVICSYFRQAAYDRLELFLECIRSSFKLTRSNYDLLVAGYRRAGLSVKLDVVMNDMKLAGFL